MKRWRSRYELVFVVLLSAQIGCAGAVTDPPEEAAEPEAVTIPLEEIWAFEMPGTRDVWELEPEVHRDVVTVSAQEQERRMRESLFNQIGGALEPAQAAGPDASSRFEPMPAFAVSGTGHSALRGAHAVLVQGNRRNTNSVSVRRSASCSFRIKRGVLSIWNRSSGATT